jgi:hypothetical protein
VLDLELEAFMEGSLVVEGRAQTIYNRFIRWSRLGVFNRIRGELVAKRRKARALALRMR